MLYYLVPGCAHCATLWTRMLLCPIYYVCSQCLPCLTSELPDHGYWLEICDWTCTVAGLARTCPSAIVPLQWAEATGKSTSPRVLRNQSTVSVYVNCACLYSLSTFKDACLWLSPWSILQTYTMPGYTMMCRWAMTLLNRYRETQVLWDGSSPSAWVLRCWTEHHISMVIAICHCSC